MTRAIAALPSRPIVFETALAPVAKRSLASMQIASPICSALVAARWRQPARSIARFILGDGLDEHVCDKTSNEGSTRVARDHNLRGEPAKSLTRTSGVSSGWSKWAACIAVNANSRASWALLIHVFAAIACWSALAHDETFTHICRDGDSGSNSADGCLYRARRDRAYTTGSRVPVTP